MATATATAATVDCSCSHNTIEIAPTERDTLGCNVLSLGDGRLLAIHENTATNQRLVDHSFDVRTYHGSEISVNGGGGPTCLTRPILRG